MYGTVNEYPYGDKNRVSRAQTRTETDYVKNGELHKGGSSASVMVTAQSDLANLPVEPGTIAYTAGFGQMWQLAANGTWVEIGG